MEKGEDQLTVVVPVWDSYVGRALAEAVESVRRQSVPARILVVDNASDVPVPPLEGTSTVRCPLRLRAGGARNVGLDHVQTPYVVFLDADDILVEGALETMLELARSRSDAVAWVLGIIDGLSGRRHRSPRRLGRFLAPFPPAFAIANAIWSLLPTQGATLLRTELVRELGGYDDSDRGGDDWPFCAALAFRGRIAFSTAPGLVYRWRPASPGGEETLLPLIAANAVRVRRRLERDAGLPRWARWVLPILPMGHALALNVIRPGVRGLRRTGSRVRWSRSDSS
jgi:hypothetical protein